MDRVLCKRQDHLLKKKTISLPVHKKVVCKDFFWWWS